MPDHDLRQPEVLVLGGGGILGEAWMSALLAGLDDGREFDARACSTYIGTSAGSIVAASLAAGLAPGARLGSLPQPASETASSGGASGGLLGSLGTVALGLGGAAAAPLASLALISTRPGGALLRRAALSRVPRGRRSLDALGAEVARSGVGWDGRLLVTAVELDTGRRVVFGAAGMPAVSVAEAVQASCAIPGVFRPVQAHGRSYVDGGAWSPTNMDAAEVSRGTVVLCLNPTGALRAPVGSLAGAIGPVSRSVAAAEALALRHRGAQVQTVNPDTASAAAMGANLMDPGPRGAVIAAALAQGRALAAGSSLRAA